mgnify:CR=1 FL=1
MMRISLALGFVLVFSATTSPVQITESLAFFLRPFAAVGLDVDALGLMTSIALRFIPLTLEEVDRRHSAFVPAFVKKRHVSKKFAHGFRCWFPWWFLFFVALKNLPARFLTVDSVRMLKRACLYVRVGICGQLQAL